VQPRTDFQPGVPAAAAPVRTARPWWVALSAFLMLLVLIGGLGNQWVTDAITRHIQRPRRFPEWLVRSDLTYAWRFSPRGSATNADRLWGAHLALVGTTLVLTLLLVALLARGRGGFWHTFVATWVSVVVSTMVSLYVFATVFNTAAFYRQFGGRAQSIFFAEYPGAALFAAICFGVVVGLVSGVIAVLVRHTTLVPARPIGPRDERGGFPPPAAGPESGPNAWDPPPWGPPQPWSGGGEQPTAAYEPVPQRQPSYDQPTQEQRGYDQPTQEQRSYDQRADESRTHEIRPDDQDQQTTEVPRPDPEDGPRHRDE
jgi:hypothetical protein